MKIKSKLPRAEDLPYSMVMVNIWDEEALTPKRGVTYSGKRYQNGINHWHRDRDYSDKLDSDQEYVWSFDGFRMSDFQIQSTLNGSSEESTPEVVKESIQNLMNWWEGLSR